MTRPTAAWVLAGLVSMLAMAAECFAAPELTVDQIVEKNLAARGGLEAWRKVETMVWVGHIESANAPAPSMQFSLELKRPNKTRFELRVQNQTIVHMFDGALGWKLRPVQGGKPELQPYTAEELSFARDGHGIGGPIMDHAAKGISVALEGMDEVEGRKAYRLGVKFPSGMVQHAWIDAQTFLDIKYEHESHNRLGQSGKVSVFYRNYQTIEGLQMPLLIESSAGNGKATDKMVIAKVLINPPLDDRMFAKPSIPGQPGKLTQRGMARHGGVSADLTAHPAVGMGGPVHQTWGH